MEPNELAFKDFAQEIADKLQKHYEGATVTLREVAKNNGSKLTGVEIREKGESVAPVIYLNEFYESYQQGGENVDSIYDTMRPAYERNRQQPFKCPTEWLLDWEQEHDKIFFMLVNAERNAELLESVPHIKFLDLAYIFKIVVEETENGTAVSTVNDKLAQSWGKDVNEIAYAAEQNQRKLLGHVRVDKLSGALAEIAKSAGREEEAELFTYAADSIASDILVVTNSSMRYGAYAAFNKSLLDTCFLGKETDIAILPSSIHECLLMPIACDEDIELLKGMPQAVNEETLEEWEVLSDNVYIYRKATREIEIVEA